MITNYIQAFFRQVSLHWWIFVLTGLIAMAIALAALASRRSVLRTKIQVNR